METSGRIVKTYFICMLTIIFVNGLLNGCSNIKETWKASEIKNPTLLGTASCQPPCWKEELKIGETTFDQASLQIEGLQEEEASSKIYFSDERSYITWIREDTSVVLHFLDDTLLFINFNSSTVDLGSIITHYGNPEKYYITEDRFGYVIDVFYPEHGIIFRSVNDFSPMSETMIVDQFTFYDPNYRLDSFYEQFYGYELNSILAMIFPWEGFGKCPAGLEFPEKCK
jgi:hypothetical protein